MRQRFNIQKLLTNGLSDPAFLDALTVESDEREQLLLHRKRIREGLKAGFKALESENNTFAPHLGDIGALRPKFWTQGSVAYRTLNDPAHTPPQQIDLDDGVYFPMELINGKPKAAKNALLNGVWLILESLCNEYGWELTKKPTCARITINHRMHMDIPVYAIPYERYVVMKEALDAQSRMGTLNSSGTTLLDPNEVYLAMWNGNDEWVQSDPKELERWFKKEISIHGERLRRICRYLKGWRDYTWTKGGPSSIALMAGAARALNDHMHETNSEFRTDCQALLEVATRLPRIFSQQLMNPVGDSELFPNGLSAEEIADIQNGFSQLSHLVRSALCNSATNQEVVSLLQQCFGQRIPSKPDWVSLISIAATVKSAPAEPQTKPKPSPSHRSA